MTKTHKIYLLLALAAVCIAGVFYLPPIAQDPAYHDFADKRGLAGVPNFGDVVGNMPFVIFGVIGMLQAWRNRLRLDGVVLWLVFFFGVFLTGFGSAYYHVSPNNDTLVWDRLPMTISFMSLFAVIIMERIDATMGKRLFPILLITGIFSVWYWDVTESIGEGDLRPYALVQFFPMLALLLILKLFPAADGRSKYLFYTLGWYLLAKVLEHFDDQVFTLLGGITSGHTLKHVAAALGTGCMISYMLHTRKPAEHGT